MHRTLAALALLLCLAVPPATADTSGQDAAVTELRFHDQVLWMEVLLEERAAETVPAELARRAEAVLAGAGLPVARLISMHRSLAERLFSETGDAIAGVDGDRLAAAATGLASARAQYDADLAAQRPPHAALRRVVRAAAEALGTDVATDADCFAGERERVMAALRGEPIPMPSGLGARGAPSAGGPGEGDASGGGGLVGLPGRKPVDDHIIRRRPGTGTPAATGGFTTAEVLGRARTLVYHQITSFADEVRLHAGNLALSADGSTIAFVNYDAPQTVYALDADGANLRRLFDAGTGSVSIDLSGDGRLALVADRSELRVVPTDGSRGERTLYRHGPERLHGGLLTGDGTAVIYVVGTGSDRGIYRVGTDGRGRRRLVGPADLASVIGVKEEHVSTIYSNGTSLDVSRDGERIVFAAHHKAYAIVDPGASVFTVHGDGTGLRRIIEDLEWVHAVGISGDGGTVAYIAQERGELPFGSAIDSDGRHDRRIAEYKQLLPGGSSIPTRSIELSHDGSVAVMGYRTVCFATDGSRAVPLGANGGYPSRFRERLVNFRPSADLRRGVFVVDIRGGGRELAMLHVEPASPSLAPTITSPELFPVEIALGTGDIASLAADVATPPRTKLTHVTASYHLDGYGTSHLRYDGLKDDGGHDDGAAGDGRFGLPGIRPSSGCPLGPVGVRIKAELRNAQDRGHATVLECDPLEVIELE